MKVVTKQIEIERNINCAAIEKSLQPFGEPIRWAIVEAKKDKFVIEGVFFVD